MSTPEMLDLLDSLDVKEIEENVYEGRQAITVAPRTYGGQFLGHLIMAAGKSLKFPLPIQSIAAHFIRGGDVDSPIRYEVTKLREQKKIANILVTAKQKDQVLCTGLIGFMPQNEERIEHSIPMPQVPSASEVPDLSHWLEGYEQSLSLFVKEPKRVDWRYVNPPSWVQRTRGEFLDYNQVWIKGMGELPEDPLIHSAVLAYASDTTIIDSVLTRNKISWGVERIITFTVNHNLWFHEPINFNRHLLYCTTSPVSHGGRAISSGQIFDPVSQRAVASASQECVVKTLAGFRPTSVGEQQ